tara:strand:- start:241049 stop:241753 length:705 start_codon:yes stop_codon:yes gene_type:complete
VWTITYKDRDSTIAKFEKLEVYDSAGELTYDSSVYAQDYGFGIKQYNNNQVAYEYSEIQPNIKTEKFHEYADNVLIKTRIYSDGDTLISRYVIDSRNDFGKPLKISTLNSKGEFLGYEKRTFKDSLLLSAKVYIKIDSTNKLINRKDISYDKSKRKIYETITNYSNSTRDSLRFNYNETGHFRTASYSKRLDSPTYMLINETHFYRRDGYLRKIIEYDFIAKEEKIHNATIEYW